MRLTPAPRHAMGLGLFDFIAVSSAALLIGKDL
jgi:hypothetical protein